MIVRRCAQDHDVVVHLNSKPGMVKSIQLADGSMSELTYPSAAKRYFLWVDGEITKRSDSFQVCEEELVKECVRNQDLVKDIKEIPLYTLRRH